MQKTKSKVGDTFSEIESMKKRLGTLYSRKVSLEEEIDTLKGDFFYAAVILVTFIDCVFIFYIVKYSCFHIVIVLIITWA